MKKKFSLSSIVHYLLASPFFLPSKGTQRVWLWRFEQRVRLKALRAVDRSAAADPIHRRHRRLQPCVASPPPTHATSGGGSEAARLFELLEFNTWYDFVKIVSKIKTGVYILQNTMGRGGGWYGAGENIKTEAVRNKLKKEGKGKRKKKKRIGGECFNLLIYGTHVCW